MADVLVNNEPLNFRVGNYSSDKVCMSVSCNMPNGEPYAVITKNFGSDIGNDTVMPMYCAFVDTNNCENIVSQLEQQGKIKPYTRFGSGVVMESGFCEYPLYEFDSEWLKEMDPEGMTKYKMMYQKHFLDAKKSMCRSLDFGGYTDTDVSVENEVSNPADAF